MYCTVPNTDITGTACTLTKSKIQACRVYRKRNVIKKTHARIVHATIAQNNCESHTGILGYTGPYVRTTSTQSNINGRVCAHKIVCCSSHLATAFVIDAPLSWVISILFLLTSRGSSEKDEYMQAVLNLGHGQMDHTPKKKTFERAP